MRFFWWVGGNFVNLGSNFREMVYYINIGSNLGNRLMNLTRAVSAIEKRFGWFELSHHVESEAWGYESQNKFLNVGMVFISDMLPIDVMHALQDIEKGINSAPHRNADGSYRDRVIDIDIMAAEDNAGDASAVRGSPLRKVAVNEKELKLPHPHLQNRPFFLEPYKELKEIISSKF